MGVSRGRNIFNTLLKMNITTWLSLIIAVMALSSSARASEPRVVCYYTNWSVYRPGTARFNPQNINPYLCTHLIYAFGGFTKDNTLKPFDKYQDIEKGGYAKFTGLKTYNKNLKTMLAIGGWNEGSTRFSPMVAAKDRRKEFVRNAIKFLRQNHFDGLDLDWEYPAFRDGGKPKDRENYSKLVKELREEFERESEKTGKPRLLLTMAVPAGIEYIQKGFDVRTLNQYLDWMNLLTYDYHSAFEPAVNHHAPLYPLEEPNEYSVDTELNIDYTIKFYLENGAERDKLVLGIPTYGRSYTLFNPDAVEIGSPADGPGEQGDATREKGYLAYYEICEALKPKTKKRNVDDDDSDEDSDEEEEEEEWTVMYPNPKAMGPVAFKGNQWVGYDDVDIVKRKAEYVAENGLGGIMFWSIDNDDFRGNCHDKPYPLIEAAKEAYIARLGATDNAIEKVAPSTRNSARRRNRPRASTTTTTTTTTAKPAVISRKSNKQKSSAITSTTPAWNIITPEPPTTPDPGADFKCTDEGFFPHPRDCKKYFWCLDSGPSNLGIVAHQFTCPSGLFFNKAADSCDFARNVLCKKPSTTTKATTAKPKTTTTTTTTTAAPRTTRKPIKISTRNSLLFRTTTTTTTTTTTPEPESEEEYEDEAPEDATDIEAEDPKVIKELIDLIKKVGGVEQLEKHLRLNDNAASTDGVITTTPSSFNKKLYQKVLERTRGKSKFSNGITDGTPQNSRRGPQNAGLDATADKDIFVKRDRPQYTTINRSRPSSSTTEEPLLDEDDEEEIEEPSQFLSRARAVDPEPSVATTARPLQYVNIRRARPTTISTSDTADDTASRNALFERVEPYGESPNSLDILSARRENMPEYVTIRRQRPTTEETTTAQYEPSELGVESQDTALEREISSQPQYTSIVRARSTTLPPVEEPNSPEPTTVLAVQISSLLNSPNDAEIETPEPEVSIALETEAPTTTPTTSTTSTTSRSTTTAAPTSVSTRRAILRRRGSTTTTTTTVSPTTTQATKERRINFLRRTKATSPSYTTDADVTTTDNIETTTGKYTRRAGSKFKSRKEPEKAGNENEKANEDRAKEDGRKRPSLNGGARRSEKPNRTFVRRRLGGTNSTTTTTTASSSTAATATRRPFRVASRRRPLPSSFVTTTAVPTTAAPTTTDGQITDRLSSEEYLQDIGDTDVIEDPTLEPRVQNAKKTAKVQRRPLVNLKDETVDQNPSATNEAEGKRQSKKYSSSFKQNQLDEKLRQRARGQDETEAVTEKKTTPVDDFTAETAVAIAAHQLLAAPIPVLPDYEEVKTTKKSYTETTQYFSRTETEPKTDSKTVYFEEFTSTPVYRTSSPDYITTGQAFKGLSTEFEAKVPTLSIPKSTFSTSTFPVESARPPPSPTPTIINTGLSGIAPTSPIFSRVPPTDSDISHIPITSLSSVSPVVSTSPRFAAAKKPIPVPVEDYPFSTIGYSGASQEPAYFTREYLLESPVTKTYDDEYQYLSPITTPQTTTRRPIRKKVHRKISTTIRPTSAPPAPTTPRTPPAPSAPPATAAAPPKPRRGPIKAKPFEKVKPTPPKRTYRPILNYDYYDDSAERVAEKYLEETKVILHRKGTGTGNIECLDIGNFPHPTSCKKFISCARIESGAIIGWEYICPKGLSFDPVGSICNWSAGLGCDEKDF